MYSFPQGKELNPIIPRSTPVPMPFDWARVHKILKELWHTSGESRVPEPPAPLILAGAAFSTGNQIRERWIALIDWANLNGYSADLAAALPPPPEYDVAEKIAGASESGSGWWPVFGEQRHKPSIRPPKDLVSITVDNLRQNWAKIVGPEIAANTKPRGFRGRKLRRLAVVASPQFKPPWGLFYFITENPQTFSAMRRAINKAIAPMEIDHISFTTAGWQTWANRESP